VRFACELWGGLGNVGKRVLLRFMWDRCMSGFGLVVKAAFVRPGKFGVHGIFWGGQWCFF